MAELNINGLLEKEGITSQVSPVIDDNGRLQKMAAINTPDKDTGSENVV